MADHFYALIMAGGWGTRLWPLSRKSRPKQMLPLIDERSMFQMTVRRLQPLLDPSRVFVIAGADHVDALQADTPEVPPENFIVEPFGRDSGPAAGLGTLAIAERDPDAIIATLSSDHYIADEERYRRVLEAAATVAERDYIVTLGISPSYPATGFGYIQRGQFLERVGEFDCFAVVNFTEKPSHERAVEFLSSGLYSWNSGMFIWSAKRALSEYERQQPVMYDLLMQMRPLLGEADFVSRGTPLWEKMPRISLDFAIMEGASDIAVYPVDIGWSDIGSWAALYDVLEDGALNNITVGSNTSHMPVDTSRTLVCSDRLVVTIGIEDLVIVDTEDALLVCRRDRSQDVREIVGELCDKGKENYL